jgi:hypothetical protein
VGIIGYISYDLGAYHALYIDAISTWASGYRPSKIRVTFNIPTACDVNIGLANSSWDFILDVTRAKSSGSQSIEENLSWGSTDLEYLVVATPDVDQTFYVTNIEFFE